MDGPTPNTYARKGSTWLSLIVATGLWIFVCLWVWNNSGFSLSDLKIDQFPKRETVAERNGAETEAKALKQAQIEAAQQTKEAEAEKLRVEEKAREQKELEALALARLQAQLEAEAQIMAQEQALVQATVDVEEKISIAKRALAQERSVIQEQLKVQQQLAAVQQSDAQTQTEIEGQIRAAEITLVDEQDKVQEQLRLEEQAKADQLAESQAEAEEKARLEAIARVESTAQEQEQRKVQDQARLEAQIRSEEAAKAELARNRSLMDEQATTKAAAEASRIAAVTRRQRAYEALRTEELAVLNSLADRLKFTPLSDAMPADMEHALDRMFEPLYLYSEVPISVTVWTNEFAGIANDNILSRDRGRKVVSYLIGRGLEQSRFRIRIETGEGLPFGTHRVRVSPEEAG